MKRILVGATLLGALCLSQFSHACSNGVVTSNTFVVAKSTITCNTVPDAKHKTIALSKSTWGNWNTLGSDTENTNDHVTKHANGIYGFPLRHTCAIEFWHQGHLGWVGIGWSGDIFCL